MTYNTFGSNNLHSWRTWWIPFGLPTQPSLISSSSIWVDMSCTLGISCASFILFPFKLIPFSPNPSKCLSSTFVLSSSQPPHLLFTDLIKFPSCNMVHHHTVEKSYAECLYDLFELWWMKSEKTMFLSYYRWSNLILLPSPICIYIWYDQSILSASIVSTTVVKHPNMLIIREECLESIYSVFKLNRQMIKCPVSFISCPIFKVT